MIPLTLPTSINHTLGYTRNRMYKLNELKEQNMRKKNRFRKNFLTPSLIQTSENNPEASLLSPSHISIEMEKIEGAPVWVDIYSKTKSSLTRVNEIHKDLQKLMAKRIRCQLEDNSSLDKDIQHKNSEAATFLQECETNLKRLGTMSLNEDQPASDKKIRKNMQKSLASEVQESALMLQKQQKGFLQKIESFNKSGKSSVLDISVQEFDEEERGEFILIEKEAEQRDAQINGVVDSINKLAALFKQLNGLVIEQGTIIDRIDYNLEESETHHAKAKVQLVKSKKSMDSGFADKFIRILTILIIVFSFLLVFKFAHRG
jgi:syntaxin 16